VIEYPQKRFHNAPIFQGYGMTETNIATPRPSQADKVDSTGKLFANMEARLVDDSLNDVESGEILVRSPTVFSRYMHDPEATREGFYRG
jgi:4-coumarate--CoA ligase